MVQLELNLSEYLETRHTFASFSTRLREWFESLLLCSSQSELAQVMHL